MKFKKIGIVFLFLLLLMPLNVMAISKDYEDLVYGVVGEEIEENKINIYFFYGNGCPHCAKEETFLDELQDKYKDKIKIFRYETWYDETNKNNLFKIKTLFGRDKDERVPFTVIGKETYLGYNEYVGKKIESNVINYLEIDDEELIIEKDKESIPLLGEVNVKDVSIGLVAVVLGLVDGFNPCAMWILLFLINMLFGMKNKKKMFLLGFTFLFTSAVVYFLSMLGISTFLSFISAPKIRSVIGIFALFVGLYNVRKYLVTRKEETGCHVIKDTKRKKIFKRIKRFTEEKNIFLALLGVIVLGVSVNIVELACSTVFPAMFSEILAVNNIGGLSRIFYLIVYTIFYMLDDMIVFIIAMATLSISAASSKYGKYSSLIGGLIMVIIGILLIFKPEWLMFNF